MLKIIAKAKALIAQHHEQVIQRQFMETAMGVSALVALADQEVSFAEEMARDYVLDHVVELQVFDPHEAVDNFRAWKEELITDPDATKNKIFQQVKALETEPHLAKLLIQIGIAIAKADYSLGQLELDVIQELSNLVGLKLQDFDLAFHAS